MTSREPAGSGCDHSPGDTPGFHSRNCPGIQLVPVPIVAISVRLMLRAESILRYQNTTDEDSEQSWVGRGHPCPGSDFSILRWPPTCSWVEFAYSSVESPGMHNTNNLVYSNALSTPSRITLHMKMAREILSSASASRSLE